ncbi:MAG: translation initiation factor IF-2 [Endomicrobium sp.]|jgi:translation initiation factor IF-2|nr:translation initiation factor IF-2 [Endomicrobium sp.]
MTLKQKDKLKKTLTLEKTIKKKVISATKEKKIATKKAAKKTDVSAIGKTIKSKVPSKKIKTDDEVKMVKTTKISSVKKNTIKKIDPEKKKPRTKLKTARKTIVKKEKDRKNEENLENEVAKEQQVVDLEPINIVPEKHQEKVNDVAQVPRKDVVEEKKPQQSEREPSKHEEPIRSVKSNEKENVKDIEKSKTEVTKDIISINELITIRELAEKMRLKVGDILKKLLSMGSLATINQRLDIDTAVLLVNEFGYDSKIELIYSGENISVSKEDNDPSKLKQRSPIVTIMGHVDHGKTSLLDSIRSSNVVADEHGGITQHIGAYKIKTSKGQYISFLDTPGHEAFTAMRARGSQATDIVILVVSAAEGVMPQTVEAINHAKAANVPIVVAINKVDLPSADPQKTRQELSNYNLVPEEWGGDTIMVDISVKQKINIDLLLEMILLKSEMMELKANPDKNAEGTVIEARLDARKGPIATLLVKSGTLKVGDNLVVGTTYGKIRALADEYGKKLSAAIPSTPVEVLGINEPPQSGDVFIVVDSESRAKTVAKSRKEKVKEASLRPRHHLSLADINMGQSKDLKIILKADVQGSLGALSDALERLSTAEISLKIIHRGAGAITESDVALAVASDALIVGFNLRPDTVVERLAEVEKVSINVYRVIYDLIADVRAAMEGLLAPEVKEKILGKATIRQVFKLSSYGTISGCSVIDGKIQRGTKARLLRDNVIVFEGNISSLRRFKDDVKEVEKGYECGIGLENFSDVKIGDIVEIFVTEHVARKLDS